jgi:hypothetical protein
MKVNLHNQIITDNQKLQTLHILRYV